MSEIIKERISELLFDSTSYAIPHLIKSQRVFNKIFWVFFLIISIIISFYYTYEAINEYYNYEIVTEIRNEYEQPAEFPTITICSLKTQYFDRYRNENWTELFKFAGFGYDYSISENKENFDKNFQWVNTSAIGRCLRFNSGFNTNLDPIPVKNSTVGGIFDSFSLGIKSPDGLAVWIHNKSSPPTIEPGDGDGNDPINISPGFQTNIIIEKKVDYKLEKPFNDCLLNVSTFVKNKTIVDYMINNGRLYSQIKCISLCFELKYIENNECNCSNTTLGNVWIDCWEDKENFDIDGCTFKSKNKFYNRNLKEYCSDYCPLECNSVSFVNTINTFKSLDSDVSGIDITIIRVYYHSLRFTIISQKPKMLWIELISNVGGTLGLFVGLSFVSLFETAEVILECIYLWFRPDQANNIRTRSKSTYYIRIK